jgi:predicted dehydrogenase
MCRKRGRIILVGVTGLELNRADFYEKELTFQVSCSYGPGRYDLDYEEGGQDYPLGFVRWTEQRNFEAVLDLMASGALDLKPLISHNFDIAEAPDAYKALTDDPSVLGILIRYPEQTGEPANSVQLKPTMADTLAPGKAVTGFIGAGNYGGRILIDAFAKAGATLDTIVSASGVSATHYGRKFGFSHAASDAGVVTCSDTIDTVVISTRHDTHARFTLDALEAGKNVFVEKPLCLTLDELSRIGEAAVKPNAPRLMVGFNRRFAPMIMEVKKRLATLVEPKCLIMTVNAGAIPNDHWTQSIEQGGGRIVGEACHFIDLLRFLTGAPVASVQVAGMRRPDGPKRTDIAAITLTFEDGSFGVINYLANGHRAYPKERLEAFCGGRVLVLDNYRKLLGYGWSGFRDMRSWRQDKGVQNCINSFAAAVKCNGPAPIPIDELLEVSRISIEVSESLGP